MRSSASVFDATLETIDDIYRLINTMKAQSAELQYTICLSRASIRQSQQAMKHADEIVAWSPQPSSSDEVIR